MPAPLPGRTRRRPRPGRRSSSAPSWSTGSGPSGGSPALSSRSYRKVLNNLVASCCNATGTPQDLAAISPEDVLAFVDEAVGPNRWTAHFVRNILRFLFRSGRIPRDLSAAVPGTALPRTQRAAPPSRAGDGRQAARRRRRRRPAGQAGPCDAPADGPARIESAGSGGDSSRRHRLARRTDARPGQGRPDRPHADPRGRRRGHRRLAAPPTRADVPAPVRAPGPAVREVRVFRVRRPKRSRGIAGWPAWSRPGAKREPAPCATAWRWGCSAADRPWRRSATSCGIDSLQSTTVQARRDTGALRQLARPRPALEAGR